MIPNKVLQISIIHVIYCDELIRVIRNIMGITHATTIIIKRNSL